MNTDYETVERVAKPNAHHGGRTMVHKVREAGGDLQQGYYVCDEEAEEFLQYFRPGLYEYALGFAEGYDAAE